jgi:hypothetical protein
MTESPELARHHDALREIRAESARLLQGLSPAQLDWRPRPKAWSIGQVASHLRATNELYAPAMRRAMSQARARRAMDQSPYRPTLFGGWLVRSMEAPRKVPSPKVFRPAPAAPSVDWSGEIELYRATQDELARLLDEARGLSLNRTRMSSPVSRIIRMNLGDAFALWLAHDRRHLGQIQRLREHPGFPA